MLESAIDHTLYPAGSDFPSVRTVTHLHGGRTPPQFDGLPEAWSEPGGRRFGASFTTEDFIYPNAQQACCLWFHDHALAITRLNIYAGLAGIYIIYDDAEDSLELPAAAYELPLIIQDKSFNEDGSLFYPSQGTVPGHPQWRPFFLGDTPLINGRAYPYFEAEPRRYRLRLLNASNSRFYNLRFEAAGNSIYPFYVIGGDGGLLEAPQQVEKILLAPAERADLLIDLAPLGKKQKLTLRNDAPAPFPVGGGPLITELMQIRISKELAGDDLSTPVPQLKLPAFPAPVPSPGIPPRQINLVALQLNVQTVQFQINNRNFADPVEERPRAGSTEIWEFINLTEDAHPMHLHMTQFAVINRQPFDLENFYAAREDFRSGISPQPDLKDYLAGPAAPPAAHESGWKDTAVALPRQVLRIAVPFDLPPTVSPPARYVYHCHILEHEENDMMRPFEVV